MAKKFYSKLSMKINFRNFQSTSLDFKIILESPQNVKMWFNQLKIFSNHNLKSLTAHHPMWLTKTCLSIMKTKKKVILNPSSESIIKKTWHLQ